MACPPPPAFAFTSTVQQAGTVTTSAPQGFDVNAAALMGALCLQSYNQYALGQTAIGAATLSGLGGSLTQLQDTSLTISESIGTGSEIGGSYSGEYATVVGGFALTGTMPDGTQANIIVLRGTRTYNEWLNDVTAVPSTWHVGTNNGAGFNDVDEPYGAVHGGFLSLYVSGTDGTQPAVSSGLIHLQYTRPAGSLAAQIQELVTAQGWDAKLPLYITGHSLGAAMAELTAMDVAVNFPDAFPAGELYVYSLAGPQLAAGLQLSGVGTVASEFAGQYAGLVPNTWCVVNAADIVPISPPSCLSLGLAQLTFQQVAPAGNVVTFIAQTGSIGGNHSCQDTYAPYLTLLQQGF